MADYQNKKLPDTSATNTSSGVGIKSKIQITTVNKAGQQIEGVKFPKEPAPIRIFKATVYSSHKLTSSHSRPNTVKWCRWSRTRSAGRSRCIHPAAQSSRGRGSSPPSRHQAQRRTRRRRSTSRRKAWQIAPPTTSKAWSSSNTRNSRVSPKDSAWPPTSR